MREMRRLSVLWRHFPGPIYQSNSSARPNFSAAITAKIGNWSARLFKEKRHLAQLCASGSSTMIGHIDITNSLSPMDMRGVNFSRWRNWLSLNNLLFLLCKNNSQITFPSLSWLKFPLFIDNRGNYDRLILQIQGI